jgi:hypothetical protein
LARVSNGRAAATQPDAPTDHSPAAASLTLLHYLDVVLVIASAPFVLLAGGPRFGYALGAGGWIVLRFAAEIVKRRAWSARTLRSRSLLHLTAILGRVWLIAAVILLARFAGSNRDGIAAAIVVLVAFTVEFTISVVLRRPLSAEAGGSR